MNLDKIKAGYNLYESTYKGKNNINEINIDFDKYELENVAGYCLAYLKALNLKTIKEINENKEYDFLAKAIVNSTDKDKLRCLLRISIWIYSDFESSPPNPFKDGVFVGSLVKKITEAGVERQNNNVLEEDVGYLFSYFQHRDILKIEKPETAEEIPYLISQGHLDSIINYCKLSINIDDDKKVIKSYKKL